MRLRNSICALIAASLLNHGGIAFAQKVQTKKMNEPAKIQTQAAKSALHPHKNERKTHTLEIIETNLEQGRLEDCEAALTSELQLHPKNDQTRFGLGVVQFLRGVEALAQDLHRYALHPGSGSGISASLVQFPLPKNANPEIVSYEKFRKTVANLAVSLGKAEATLSPITDVNVKLPLRFGMIRMDLDGDGQTSAKDSLWNVYTTISRNEGITVEQAENFSIKFDRGDVHWLRGYCHLISAVCQIYLAHDSHEMFERTAHLIFTKVDSPYQFLTSGKYIHQIGESGADICDLIALIHLINWPVAEPERMKLALHHFEDVVKQSKDMWKYILAETDDDREWIPNPRQTGVIPGVKVTDEMVVAWTGLMGDIEKILAGEKLIAFWRGDKGQGVNLRRVFLEPRTLDLVLWVQGTAAAPYLESGNTTKIATWNSLQNAFGRQFPGFALWFN